MANNWTTLAEAFAAGGFPWLSQFKQLKIHFKTKDLDCKSIYNFFASLFGLSVYAYFAYVPAEQFKEWPAWWWFMAAAMLLTFIYFVVFVYFRSQVDGLLTRWPIILNFVIYVFIFVTLTTGFSLLQLLSDYTLVRGEVRDRLTKDPLSDVRLEFRDDHGAYSESTETDENGRFYVYIKRDQVDKIKKISYYRDDYEADEQSLTGGERVRTRYRFTLSKNPKP